MKRWREIIATDRRVFVGGLTFTDSAQAAAPLFDKRAGKLRSSRP